jgi:hypothetical protein
MFHNAYVFNGDLKDWNVSSVSDFSYMFNNARVYNAAIDDWDVSAGVNFQGMFNGAKSFSANITGWDTMNAIDLSEMFQGASMFNMDVSSWNIDNVVTMGSMFNEAASFDLDLSSWNVSRIRDLSLMFRETKLDQSYCKWEKQLTNDTNVGRMFFGTNCDKQNDPGSPKNTSDLYGPFCRDCGNIISPAAGLHNLGPLSMVVGILTYMFLA